MDLAEKRKQLEAVRAARQAKQQVVEQYITGRSVNSGGAANVVHNSTSSAAVPASTGAATKHSSTTISTPASPPSSLSSLSSGHTATGTAHSKIDLFPARPAAGAGAVRVPSPTTSAYESDRKVPRPRRTPPAPSPRSGPATGTGAASPSTPSARELQKPALPSSAAAKVPASPIRTLTTPGAGSSVIHVLPVGTPQAATHSTGTAAGVDAVTDSGKSCSTPAPTSKTLTGSTVCIAPTQKVPPTGATPTSPKSASPVPHSTGGGDVTDAKWAAQSDVRLDGLGGWSALQRCVRGGGSFAREHGGETSIYPVCAFNPAVVLGGATGSPDSSRRRAILDSTACLVPYEGAAGLLVHSEANENDSTIWSICVAATYGTTNAMYRETTSGGDYPPSGSGLRRSSVESVSDGSGASPACGANGMGRSAESALWGVRASMECGYPWGSASVAQTAVPGNTMDAALRVARQSPGLVLAWIMVPLPASTIPHKEGTLYVDTSANSLSGPRSSSSAGAASAATGQEDFVVVVVPFVCDSEVTTLLAHPFQPSTLLGGTRCGRVVQWSIGQAWAQVEPRRLIERALATTGTATTLLLPPQRPTHSSFPSPQAHQAPVLCMAIHGDISCHHLYSISQEGKVCTWPAWQPLHPTASCLSYLGIRPMGSIGVAAQFAERPGTDAMTQVFIGTTSGALLVGANRDSKSIELQYYGPPRPLPTSSTVIKTLDVTAIPATGPTNFTVNTATTASGPASSTVLNMSQESPTGLGALNLTAIPTSDPNAVGSRSGKAAVRRPGAEPPSPSSQHQAQQPPSPRSSMPLQLPPLSQPHHGRIVSMSLQTATHGFRGQDCVVSAATDGSCVAWFHRTVIPLEGFSSAVTSVCWSPTKPGVMAAGDSSGLVTVWAVNTSIITPAGTVSLWEASRRTRGNATSDAVLWVLAGPSDAGGLGAGGSGSMGSGPFDGAAKEDDDIDVVDDGNADATLEEADTIGVAISSVFFSRDGRWLFASTSCGYIYSMRVSASLA